MSALVVRKDGDETPQGCLPRRAIWVLVHCLWLSGSSIKAKRQPRQPSSAHQYADFHPRSANQTSYQKYHQPTHQHDITDLHSPNVFVGRPRRPIRVIVHRSLRSASPGLRSLPVVSYTRRGEAGLPVSLSPGPGPHNPWYPPAQHLPHLVPDTLLTVRCYMYTMIRTYVLQSLQADL
jgi:hypothetical protein